MVRFCHKRQDELNERELQFIVSMMHWRGMPTERQQNWLCDIYARLTGEGR